MNKLLKNKVATLLVSFVLMALGAFLLGTAIYIIGLILIAAGALLFNLVVFLGK